MLNEPQAIKSKLYEERLEQLQKEFLCSPFEVLSDLMDRLKDSAEQHGFNNNLALADDILWLSECMNELLEAFNKYDDPKTQASKVPCYFRRRYQGRTPAS